MVSALFAFLPVTTLNQYRHTAVVIRRCVELSSEHARRINICAYNEAQMV